MLESLLKKKSVVSSRKYWMWVCGPSHNRLDSHSSKNHGPKLIWTKVMYVSFFIPPWPYQNLTLLIINHILFLFHFQDHVVERNTAKSCSCHENNSSFTRIITSKLGFIVQEYWNSHILVISANCTSFCKIICTCLTLSLKQMFLRISSNSRSQIFLSF